MLLLLVLLLAASPLQGAQAQAPLCCPKSCRGTLGGACDDDGAFCAPFSCQGPSLTCDKGSGVGVLSTCAANTRWNGLAEGVTCNIVGANPCREKTLTSPDLECIDDMGSLSHAKCYPKQWLALGQACNSDELCDSQACVNGTCWKDNNSPGAANGQTCSDSKDCLVGSFCRDDGATSVCAAVLAPGAVCNLNLRKQVNDQCPKHQFCHVDNGVTTATCKARYTISNDQPCQNDGECASVWCNNNVCTATPAPTLLSTLPPCATNGVCPQGSACKCNENNGQVVCVTDAQQAAEQLERTAPAICATQKQAYITCATTSACGVNFPEFSAGCCDAEEGALKGCALQNANANYNLNVDCDINIGPGPPAAEDAASSLHFSSLLVLASALYALLL